MKGYCKLTFLVFLVLLNKLTFLKYRVPLFMTGYINLPLSSVFPSTVHDRLYKPTWGSRFPSTWQIKLTYMRFRVPLYITGYINLSEVLGSPLHDRLYKPTWGSGFPSTWQVQVTGSLARCWDHWQVAGIIGKCWDHWQDPVMSLLTG